MKIEYFFMFFVIVLSGGEEAKPCIGRILHEDSNICVCNATYCDSIETFEESDIENGAFVRYESTMAGKRLYLTKGKFLKRMEPYNILGKIVQDWLVTSFTVYPNVTHQTIFGFGGGLSDTVGSLLTKLSNQTRELILRQYFGNEGLNYTLLRLSMGCSDFSLRPYSYDDNGTGYSLSNFQLAMEDYQYKIPLLKQMQIMSKGPIKIIGTPWTTPKRMREILYHTGPVMAERLKDDYYQPFAKYFIKFLDAYKKEGIKIWALTMQNEPFNAFFGLPPLSAAWTAKEQGKFIGENLGPLLHSTGYGNTKILALDEDWIFNTIWMKVIMKHAKKYISGLAYHSYFQSTTHPGVLSIAHQTFPDIFLLHTEYSILFTGLFQPAVRFGRWANLENYVTGITDALNNWVTGFMDWNIVLNEDGGPGFMGNRIDSPIIINNTVEEFYKEPTWYGIAHFAHFIPPGSIHIELKEWRALGIQSTAMLTPENRIVIVLMNRRDQPWDIVINVGEEEQIQATLGARSLNTFIYKLSSSNINETDINNIETTTEEHLPPITVEQKSGNVKSFPITAEQKSENLKSFSASNPQCNSSILTLLFLPLMLFHFR